MGKKKRKRRQAGGGDLSFDIKGDIHQSALGQEATVEITNVLSGASEPPETDAKTQVFISYSSKDDAFAKRLRADLAARGIVSFYAPDSLTVGAYTHAALEEAAARYPAFVVVISEASLASEWVRREVVIALELELRAAGTKVFPIRVDEAILDTSVEWGIRLQKGRNVEMFPDPERDDAGYHRALRRLVEAMKS